MICEPCEKFFHWLQSPPCPVRGEKFREEFYHHRTWRAWKEAVAEGCVFCTYTQQRFVYEIKSFLNGNNSSFRKILPTCSWDRYDNKFPTLVLGREGEEFNGHGRHFELVGVKLGQDRLEIAGYQPTVQTDSKACLDLAKHWLTTCQTQHTKCERPRTEAENNWKPTRLIRIYEDHDTLRLCEGEDIPEFVTYATLSHCWGNIEDKLVLTLENNDDWKKAIPSFSKLKTFQDVLQIARHLGLWYIWIDSLCIIQNSKEDWQVESSQMSNVYKYSLCNISATSATSDIEGCFFSRRLSDVHLEPLRINFHAASSSDSLDESGLVITAKSRRDSPRTLQGRYELFQDGVFGMWSADITSGAVNRRAWVVQERLLAPRVLHFSKTQLYWECTELQASESFPFGLPNHGRKEEAAFKVQSPFNFSALVCEGENSLDTQRAPAQKAAFRIWGEAVKAFTSADLTYESDKLVAISAIAREMKPLMQCRYLAGHWETDLIHQLAWSGGYRATQQREYRAPSWSWASINSDIDQFIRMYNSDKISHPLAEVIEVQIELATDDEMGQVKGGFLKLRGELIEADYRHYAHSKRGQDSIFVNDNETTMLLYQDNDDRDEVDKLASLWEPYTKIWCLPLEASFSSPSELSCLVLIKVEDEIDTFRRVGVVRYYDPTKDEVAEFKNPFLPLVKGLGEEVDLFPGDEGNVKPLIGGAPHKRTKNSSNLKDVKII